MQLIVFDEFPEDRVFPIKELLNQIKYWQCPVKGAFPGSCETGKYGNTLAAARLLFHSYHGRKAAVLKTTTVGKRGTGAGQLTMHKLVLFL